jgi:small subunit ribosomal protein S15e
MVVLPEMIGAIVGVYNGKDFVSVEIKDDMVGHFIGEFSLTYHPVQHGRPGVGSAASKFVPLK